MLSQDIPQRVLQDVIALQGTEIIRLEAELSKAQERIRYLESLISGSHVDESSVPPGTSDDNHENETEHSASVDPAIELDAPSHPAPKYGNEDLSPIVPTEHDNITRLAIRRAQKAMLDDSLTLSIPEGSASWDDNYDVVTVIKPTKSISKQGVLHGHVWRRVKKTQHVVAKFAGGLYYCGQYRRVREERVDFGFFQTLPERAQQVVLGWCGSKKMRAEIVAALQSGEIPLLRSELRRASFDEALYTQLLSAIPSQDTLSLVRNSADQAAVYITNEHEEE